MGDLNSQNKISELLEVVAAIVVTAGLVAGKLLLFSPLRVDKRIKLQHLQLNLRTQLARI